MSDGMEELARRLVVGRKSDGRSVYDEAAKAELVAACGWPSASVLRLARECGVNANQRSRWDLRAMLVALPKAKTVEDFEALLPWRLEPTERCSADGTWRKGAVC